MLVPRGGALRGGRVETATVTAASRCRSRWPRRSSREGPSTSRTRPMWRRRSPDSWRSPAARAWTWTKPEVMAPAVPVIAIDGPSGSGKGTVSRRVAMALGWHLLDSGALFPPGRTGGPPVGSGPPGPCGARGARARHGRALRCRRGGEEEIFLDGRPVAADIRTRSGGRGGLAGRGLAPGREGLLARQRMFAEPPGLVADGRNMGSVRYSDGGLRGLLTASAEERARRRHKQLKDKGLSVNLAALSAEIAERDRRDATRAVAPLRRDRQSRSSSIRRG